MPPINMEIGPWVLTIARIELRISVMRKSITGKEILKTGIWEGGRINYGS